MENQEHNFGNTFKAHKSFNDFFTDKKNSYPMVKLYVDGKEFKHSFSLEINQKTNDHDTLKIVTPDDSFDSFEGSLMEKSRHLFGKNVSVQFARFGKITQSFTGIITNIDNPKNEGGGYGDLHIMGTAASILLESGKDCRSFEDKTLEQIIKEICEDYPEEAKIEIASNNLNLSNQKAIPYTVQYKESDYQFIQRLAKLHGEFFYYNGEKLIFGNKTQPLIELGENLDLIRETFSASLRSQDFKYLGYDAETGSVIEKDSKSIRSEFKENHFGAMAIIASRKIFKKIPVMYFNNAKNEQELTEAVRLDKEKREHLFFVKGKSRDPELRIGGKARISDINSKAMETYRITEIKHFHDNDEYYNEFLGIPNFFSASPYIDNEAFPPGEIQSARVTDNNDPLKMGRVRVQFPWQIAKNQTTPWIRMIQPHSGAGKGFHFVPEIGEEVLIGFESGNAEKPFVMGTHYNGSETSSYHTSGNDKKVIHTRSGTKIILNDAEGSVFIEDPSGNTYLMDGQGNINVDAPKNMSFTAGENVSITAGMNIIVSAGLNISENAGLNHSSFAGAMMMQNAVADYSLNAANITNIASDKITKEAKDYTKQAEKIELYASKENVQIKSAKTVQINSGENSNLH